MISTPPAIRASGLTKTFRATDGSTVVAVERVDLTVHRGEIVAFLGPNGAGKTTTVDMLLGLTSPTAGEVEIVGMTPRQAVEAGRVSAVMQTGGLLPDFTVGETVEAIAALHGRLDRVEEVIERAGLTVVRGRKVQACSGGEQQRLRFALALIPDPDVILLDEPTTGMDVAARQAFWDTMRADAATGRTIVFATHYLAEADAFAERTVLMAARPHRRGRPDRGCPRRLRWPDRVLPASGRGRTPRRTRRGVAGPRPARPGAARRRRGRGRQRQPGGGVPRPHEASPSPTHPAHLETTGALR